MNKYSDSDQDFYTQEYYTIPLEEDTVPLEEYEQELCPVCRAVINPDGTVDNCMGECDLEIASRLQYDTPLNFNK